jgi:hypothetical protein
MGEDRNVMRHRSLPHDVNGAANKARERDLNGEVETEPGHGLSPAIASQI